MSPTGKKIIRGMIHDLDGIYFKASPKAMLSLPRFHMLRYHGVLVWSFARPRGSGATRVGEERKFIDGRRAAVLV